MSANTTTGARAKSAEVARKIAVTRNLITAPSSLRDATAAATGKALVTFMMAQIAVLQRRSIENEEVPVFDDDQSPGDKPWQTYENLVSPAPEKGTSSPVTVSTDAKMALTAVLILAADAVNNSAERLPGHDLPAALAKTTPAVRMMIAVVAAAKHLLRVDPLSRDGDWVGTFQKKFEAFVSGGALVDPGGAAVARLYVDFLKVVAWHGAVAAYEAGHLTMNTAALFTVLAGFQLAAGEAHEAAVADTLRCVREMLEKYAAEMAAIAAATPKTTPKRREAAAAADGAEAADPEGAAAATPTKAAAKSPAKKAAPKKVAPPAAAAAATATSSTDSEASGAPADGADYDAMLSDLTKN